MRKLSVVASADKEFSLSRPAILARRDLISLHDLTPGEIEYLLKLAQAVKGSPSRHKRALEGKSLAMVLEKPSLCTRVAFELGMVQLSGRTLYFGPAEVGLGQRAAVKDVARNLSRWVDAVMVRVFSHQTALELAEYASIPVMNGLSDFEHAQHNRVEDDAVVLLE